MRNQSFLIFKALISRALCVFILLHNPYHRSSPELSSSCNTETLYPYQYLLLSRPQTPANNLWYLIPSPSSYPRPLITPILFSAQRPMSIAFCRSGVTQHFFFITWIILFNLMSSGFTYTVTSFRITFLPKGE